MNVTYKSTKIITLAAIFILLVYGILYLLPDNVLRLVLRSSFTTACLYSMILVCWMISVHHRIINSRLRRMFYLIAGSFIFWFVLQLLKYDLNDLWAFCRYCWYGYYIPQVLAPLCGLYAAFYLVRPDSMEIDRRWFLLLIPAFLLILLVMTNDLHQLAFSFEENFVNWGKSYRHGPVYFLIFIWMLSLTAGCLVICMMHCTILPTRRRIWIPILVCGLGTALSFAAMLDIQRFYMVPQSLCIAYIGFWESCIQIGLIPSNSGYFLVFANNAYPVLLADMQGNVVLSSSDVLTKMYEKQRMSEDISAERNHAESGDTRGEETDNLRMSSFPIHGGTVFWLDDLSAVRTLNDQQAEINKQLQEENNLLAEENALRAKQLSAQQQLALYGRVSAIIEPQLKRSLEILNSAGNEMSRADLERLCILNAYTKRISNLVLKQSEEKNASVRELYYCMQESADALCSAGIPAAAACDPEDDCLIDSIISVYSTFEQILEAALPKLESIYINIRKYKDGIKCSVMMDLSDISGYTAAASLPAPVIDENTLYYTFMLKEADEAHDEA